MYFPELDALCHEVSGKLSELRRLTMESPVLTDDQEVLLAELTRLLRLVSAASSQQIYSLLGDTTTSDPEFIQELRQEFSVLAEPAPLLTPGHAPKELATPDLPAETVLADTYGEPLEIVAAHGYYPRRWALEGRDPARQFASCDINGTWWLVNGEQALRFASRIELDAFLTKTWNSERATVSIAWPPLENAGEPLETMIPDGMLELLYWDVTEVYPGERRLLFARDSEQKWCLIVESPMGQVALSFGSQAERNAYLDQVYRVGGNARRLEDAVEDEN